MRVGQSSGLLRDWVLENHDIVGITFYGNGIKYYHTNRGFLETMDLTYVDNVPKVDSHDVTSVNLDDVIRANKENLNRTDNYVLSTRKDTFKSSNPSNYILYIYLSEPPEQLGEYLVSEGNQSNQYASYVLINLNATVSRRELDEDENVKKVESQVTQIVLEINRRSEMTEFGISMEAVEKELRDQGINIGYFELNKLLKCYKLVPREE